MPSAAPARDACIVAGGQGTRLQPLTYTTPKPLLPFCGQPFLAGVIRRLAASGVERVWLVVGQDTAPFEALRPDAQAAGVRLELVPEPTPLDTAGGVAAVVDQLRGPFLVCNGDVLTDVDYAAVVRSHHESGAAATLVLTRVEDTSTYGVCVRDGSRIVDFVEKPPPGALPGQDAVNAGTYVLEPEILAGYLQGAVSFERQVFPQAAERGLHLEGFVWDGVWADLGTPERFLSGHHMALHGQLAWPAITEVPEGSAGIRVHPGATVADGARLRAPVLIHEGATVEDGATVGPTTVVGHGAGVEAGAEVIESVLFDDVHIAAGVRVTGLLAGTGATVAAGAQVGRDVVLGDGELVGPGEKVADAARRPPAGR